MVGTIYSYELERGYRAMAQKPTIQDYDTFSWSEYQASAVFRFSVKLYKVKCLYPDKSGYRIGNFNIRMTNF
jgi:hypothetical protein